MNTDAPGENAVSYRRIHCLKCGDVVGVLPDDICDPDERDNVHPLLRCKGHGNHSRPTEKSIRTHWGLVEEFLFCYPETETRERAFRYIGPPWWPLLFWSLLLIVKRNPHERFKKIRISGKILLFLPHRWVFWRKLRNVFSAKEN